MTVSASSSSPSSSALPLSPEAQVGLKPGSCSESETQNWGAVSQRRSGGWLNLWQHSEPHVRLQMSSWGSILDAVWASAGAGPVDSRRLLLHLYLDEGGRRHTEQETPTPAPSFPSPFSFFPSLPLSFTLPLSIYNYLIMQRSYSSSVFKYSATD